MSVKQDSFALPHPRARCCYQAYGRFLQAGGARQEPCLDYLTKANRFNQTLRRPGKFPPTRLAARQRNVVPSQDPFRSPEKVRRSSLTTCLRSPPRPATINLPPASGSCMAPPQETLFRRLRPCCVRLSQLSLKARVEGSLNVQELSSALNELHAGLKQADDLDDALCDYVLFPLLPLFRQAASLPASVLATALQCLRDLLEKGESISSKREVKTQLLLLLMSLLQKQSSQLSSKNASEPVILALCQCLESLLRNSEPTFPPAPAGGTEPRLVITGNLLADLLDVAHSDQVSAARVTALNTIKLLLSYEKRGDVLRRFLPGVLSKLTRPVFMVSSKSTSYKAAVASLNVLTAVLPRAVHQNQPKSKNDDGDGRGGQSTVQQWLEVNTVHLKSALQNIVGLKVHVRQEVRAALYDLCKGLLNESPISSEVNKLLLDTMIEICGDDDMQSQKSMMLNLLEAQTSLQDDFYQIASLTLQNLSSIMQSPDMKKRQEAVKKAKSCVQLASAMPPGLEDLSELIVESVFECVGLLGSSGTGEPQKLSSSNELTFELSTDASIDEIFVSNSGSRADVDLLKSIVQTLMHTRYATSLLDTFSDAGFLTYGQTGVSRLWTLTSCVKDLQAMKQNHAAVGTGTLIAYKDAALSTAYESSLSLLDKAPLSGDWRLQALALEIIGDYAIDEKSAFRPELSFALYPIVERLACQDERLTRHASKTLQRIAEACGYDKIQDVLLLNADYLINAVSIKLNDLEPRPEAARVLQAAIRIGGTPMLPYLGDVMESVFSTLDSYHGYPTMVDSMFSVLGSMVEQAPVHDGSHLHTEPLLQPRGPPSVSEIIKKISELSRIGDDSDEWLVDDSAQENEDKQVVNNDAENGVGHVLDQSEKAVTKTVERIVKYSQYYLTYETPQVRLGLLNVLQKGFLALSHDEDTLLPVINDLWPVTISRVYDPEPFVSIGALETISVMIKCAGDFMSSRIEDEWDRLHAFILQRRPGRKNNAKNLKPRTNALMQINSSSNTNTNFNNPGDLTFSSAQKIWKAVLELTATIVLHVRITAGMEADLFVTFGEHLSDSEELEKALCLLNPDAFWLVKMKEKQASKVEAAAAAAAGGGGDKEEEEKEVDGKSFSLSIPTLHGYTFAPLSL